MIARELLVTPTAPGILPLGSARNLARGLGVPRDRDQAAVIAAGATVRASDVGESAAGWFFEMASIRLNAALFEEAQRIDRGRRTSLLAGRAGTPRRRCRLQPRRHLLRA